MSTLMSPLSDDDELLTMKQIAQDAKLSAKTMYRVASEDPTFPAVRIGGTLRVRRGRWKKWLEQQTQGAAQPRGRRSA
jgi:predicted DNA-binding transcriptional regulator AlpA